MNITVIILIILTFTSRFVGVAREMVLAYFYGASRVSDAYLISLTIPTVILGFIAAGISTGYIPIYRKLELKNQEQQFTNQVMNMVLLLCAVIFLIAMIFTPQLVWMFASGFDVQTHRLTVIFTRITLVAVFLTGSANILQGFLQVKEKFFAASLVGIPFNIVIMIFIFISAYTQVYWLAIGSVLAIVAQVVYLYLLARKQGFRYQRKLNIKDESLHQMIILAFPVILGNSVEQVDRLVDKTLASHYAVGGISALTYASRIMTAIQGIFIASVLTVLYPKIAQMAAKQDIKGMKQSLKESIIGVSLFIIPAIVAVMIFSEPIVALLFGRGAFDEAAVSMTAGILFFYIASMFGSGIQSLLSRAFYSMQDTKTPMINATIAIILNITFNLILAPIMGITGLAMANTLAATISMILMYKSLHGKIGGLNLKVILWALAKIIFATLIMSIFSLLTYDSLLDLGSNLAFILAAMVGVISYVILILLLKFEEVQLLLSPLKKKT